MCFCKYEDHDVQSEDEIHHKILRDMFRKQRGLTENGFNQLPEIKSGLKLSDDVKSNFIQVPKVSSSQAVSWICWLTHYSLVLLFYIYLKGLPKGFLMFSGGIEKQHRTVMG